MAPRKRQSLIPISVFLKKPSKKTIQKHNRIVKKSKPKPKISTKTLKNIQDRKKREKEIEEGAATWDTHLTKVYGPNHGRDTELLYLVHGAHHSEADQTSKEKKSTGISSPGQHNNIHPGDIYRDDISQSSPSCETFPDDLDDVYNIDL